MGQDLNRSIKIYLDSSNAQQSADALKSRIGELEAKLQQLAAAGEGNSKQANKFTKELDAQRQKLEVYNQKVEDTERVLRNLSGAAKNELDAVYKELSKDLNKLGRDTDEYKQKLKLLNAVDRERQKAIAEQRAEVGRHGSAMTRLADGFNKYAMMATAGIAALSGVVLSIKGMVSGNAELSDSFADVKKTTGMSIAEVKVFYKELKNIDTRTSRADLMGLAEDAGKLGIVGKENIMQFVRAADKIKVALGEDLGQDAVKDIGKLTEVMKNVPVVFDGVSKNLNDMSLEDKMLAVGSAVNDIGQNSSASEAYLVEFTKRLAGVSSQAQIGIGDVIGYASALDQAGLNVEQSATAVQQFFMKIMENPSKFAKIAGIEVSKFNDLLRKDTNAAIITVLEAMNKKGGFQQLIPIFKDMGADGARAVSVLSSLATNVDKVVDAQNMANQSFIKGTSINNEFNTKNENLAGTLEKLSKNMKGWFMNSTLVEWFSSIASGLEKLTRESKSATSEYEELSKKMVNMEMNIVPLLSRYDELSTKANKSASENSELKRIVGEVAGVMPGAVTAIDQYGNAISISTSRVREFIEVEKARLKVVNAKAIKENKDALSQVETDLIQSKKRIDEINKTGTFTTKRTITNRSTGDVEEVITKATAAEIAAEQEKYRTLISQKTGYTAEIERLNGDSIDKQIAQMNKEKAAREKQAAIEKAYFGKTKKELQDLIDKGDELAKKTFATKYPKPVDDPEADKKALKDKSDLIDTWMAQERVKAKLADDGTAFAKQKLNDRLEEIELEGLRRRLAIRGLEPKQIAEIEEKIIDTKKKMVKKTIDFERNSTYGTIQSLDDITKEGAKSMKQTTDQVNADQQANFDKEQDLLKKKADLQQEYTNIAGGFMADLGTMIGDQMASSEQSAAEFQYNMLMMALDTLRQIVMLSATEAIAREIGTKGIAGIATGAAAAFAINLAFAAIKGMIKKPSKEGADTSSSNTIQTGTRVVTQRAQGKYDVIGNEDGFLYRGVQYGGDVPTGVVSRPTLYGERGAELAVSAPDFRKLKRHINYPVVVQAINDVRSGLVPQRSQGKYDGIGAGGSVVASDPELKMLIAQNLRLMESLEKNGVRGKVLLSDYEDQQARKEKNKRLRQGKG